MCSNSEPAALDESKCIRIQKLFALGHESRIIELYLDRITKETAGALSQREIERLDALASATITLIEESECIPSNHLVSLKPDPGIAKSIDGKAANFAISAVSLKKVAGCACSIATVRPCHQDPAYKPTWVSGWGRHCLPSRWPFPWRGSKPHSCRIRCSRPC